MRALTFLAAFFAVLIEPSRIRAQDPNLAVDDLEYTKNVIAHNHFIAHVEIPLGWGTGKPWTYRYQYDRYPDLEMITLGNGQACVRKIGMPWKISNDLGKTGSPADEATSKELDRDAAIANLPFQRIGTYDPQQGRTIWKLVDDRKNKDAELFTYEMTREHPHPNGVYPRLTFTKYKNDKDGNLLLTFLFGPLYLGNRVIPFITSYKYMIIAPAKVVAASPAPQ